MNTYMQMQINNALSFLKAFVKSCELAAVKDDGVISKEEEKQLKEIKSAADQFRKRLEKIK